MIDLVNLLTSFAVGTVGAGIVGAIIQRRMTSQLEVWRSRRAWEERAVAELLGPVCIQLRRTKRAFERWDRTNLFLEAEVVRAGNISVRDFLLSKPHLIPPHLRDQASELILHYDVWIEEFDKARGKLAPLGEGAPSPSFVFAGPKGYPFPRSAEQGFEQAYKQSWCRLYGEFVQDRRTE